MVQVLRCHYSSSLGFPRPSLSPEGWTTALICGEFAASFFLHLLLEDSQQRLLKQSCGPGLKRCWGPRSPSVPGFTQLHFPVAKISDFTSAPSGGHCVDTPRLSSPPIQIHKISSLLLKSFTSLNKVSFLHQAVCVLSNCICRYILFELTMACDLKRL